MGILYGKFRVGYLNFSGRINIKSGIINYLDFISIEYNVEKIINENELYKIFDTFYNGQISKKDGELIIVNVPVRVLYFETEGKSTVIAIGHLQNDLWISKFENYVVTEEIIVKKQVELYLKDVINEFPRSVDKFMHILNHNPYEICEMLNLKDVSPFDISLIFKETFESISNKITSYGHWFS